MKLYHEAFSEAMSLTEDNVNVIIIENESLFYTMVKSFSEQVENADGEFILSKNDAPISIGSNVHFVRDLFGIENVEKTMMTKIKSSIVSLANDEENFLSTADLIGNIERYFGELLLRLDYPVRLAHEIDIADLIKVISLDLERDYESLTDMICSYIRLYSLLLNKNVFSFLNLKQYLSKDELESLAKFCRYEKIYLLLFEGTDKYMTEGENRIIVDKDLCTI